MSADVVITTPSRTYRVPTALTASVGQEQVTIDDVFDALENVPEAREWAEKIIGGMQRDEANRADAVLASIEYDPSSYLYWGFTASGDDDYLVSIARCALDDLNLNNAEEYSKAGWRPIISVDPSSAHGVAMDRELLAFTASALRDGCKGVFLVYGEPYTFLSEEPLLAAGPPDVLSQGGHVYAIVDATDTTAVMDVIMLKPGPEAYRRDGKAWVLDNATLDSLLSASPPPIVELSGPTLTSVLEQVDGSQAQQLAPNEDGSAAEGELLGQEALEAKPVGKPAADKKKTETQKPKEIKKPTETPSQDSAKSNQDKSQLKDGSSMTASSVLGLYEDGTLLAGLVASSGINSVTAQRDAAVTRLAAVEEAVNVATQLRIRAHQIENILLPALTADAKSVHDATPNQRKASNLRKYWVRGKGASKISWGTAGDFRRCVTQMTKYLGAGAKGYCAKRHKETVGYWPGDKRNTGPLKGNTGQKSRK